MARFYEITAGADQVYFGRCSMAYAVQQAKDTAIRKGRDVTLWRAHSPKQSMKREPMMLVTPESALGR